MAYFMGINKIHYLKIFKAYPITTRFRHLYCPVVKSFKQVVNIFLLFQNLLTINHINQTQFL